MDNLLLRRRAMIGNGVQITRIAYLESADGLPCIDTRVVPTSNTSIECEFEFTSISPYASIYGNYIDEYHNVFRLTQKSTSDGYLANPCAIANMVSPINKQVGGWQTSRISKNLCQVDDEINNSPQLVQGTSNTTSIALLKEKVIDTATTTRAKMAWCKIYENNVLIRDFVPVRVGDEGFMLDRVSNRLYSNAGAGSFVLGPDIYSTFTRRIAGDGEYGNGKATIQSIRGNTLKWNQLCKNGNFANGMTNWTVNNEEHATVSVSGGVLSGSWDGTGGNGFRQTFTWKVGHKYYIAVTIKNALAENTRYMFIGPLTSAALEVRFQPGETRRVTGVVTITSATPSIFSVNASSNAIFAVEMSNVVIVDLTPMYGAGNEPTLDKFKALYPNLYYAYNVGTLLSFKGEGLMTDGFNQWDEVLEVGSISTVAGSNIEGASNSRSKNYIPVCAGMQYYIDAVVYRYYYDANKDYLPSCYDNSGTQLFTIPSEAAYLRFRQATSELPSKICINFSDAFRNGEYEPHWASTLNLPITTATGKLNGEGESEVVAPDGMNRIGSVYDEIIVESSMAIGEIKRIGIRAYQSGDESDASVLTDGTNTAYVLSTSLTYIFDTPFPVNYRADSSGTETLLPQGVDINGVPYTAPITASIAYKKP